MQINLEKFRDGYALPLDRSTIDRLQITPDTVFDVETRGNSLILTPLAITRAEFEAAIQETQHKFGDALKKLGE